MASFAESILCSVRPLGAAPRFFQETELVDLKHVANVETNYSTRLVKETKIKKLKIKPLRGPDCFTMKLSNSMKEDVFSAFFIIGPTCSGKTAVAQLIAEAEGFDILSADSMLVYKGMDIGTAKPGAAELARVRYRGIDVAEPGDSFSVAMYRNIALDAFSEAASSGRRLIVAGGTGLYIRSILDGLSPRAPADPVLRLKAENILHERGVAGLQEWLRRENRNLLDSLPDKMNPRRLVRALEMTRGSRAPDSARWRNATAGPLIPGLRFPSEQLRDRIEKRTRAMFQEGLLDEVARLLAMGFDAAPTARQAIGYAEAVACTRGILTLEQAIERTIIRTRQLVKKQNTWFRRQSNVHWIECDNSMSPSVIARLVSEYWKANGPTPVNTHRRAFFSENDAVL